MVFCTHLIRGSRNYGILFSNKLYLNLKKQQRESQLFHATEFFRAVDSARERFQPPDRLSSLNNESGKKFFFPRNCLGVRRYMLAITIDTSASDTTAGN